ncbi:MAG TPA: sn-glycerol-3-phosphate ABC transporter ATP-binding protein UgpC [Phycisphaerales bacterium]|nr:sn-glycerol-3-phosphate ABC transporter ATP-binding protein UgpC [Phycisphaerales bacterium]
MASMGTLSLQNVCKTFAGGVVAVKDVTFSVAPGAFCVLLGPSGCGKSTTLRMVAGLEGVSSGTISIDGTVLNSLHPKDRDIAMVFQNYALYPHLTVAENIAFPLSMRGVPKEQVRARVARAAGAMQLTDLLARRPAQLSGGQRQRVAVARAIVREPKVFLFDEPLSNLDARMRMQTRNELRALHHRLRVTSLYVTHDQEEALSLADMIVVMAGGRVRQVGTPMEVFDSPADRFVAGFVGTPAMNFVEATATFVDGVTVLDSGVFQACAPHVSARTGHRYTLGIRPSHIQLAPNDAVGGVSMHAVVGSVEYLGDVMDISLTAGAHTLTARTAARPGLVPGEAVRATIDPRHIHVFEPGPDGISIGRAAAAPSIPVLTAT